MARPFLFVIPNFLSYSPFSCFGIGQGYILIGETAEETHMKKLFAVVMAVFEIGMGTLLVQAQQAPEPVPARPGEERPAETGPEVPLRFELRTHREPAPTRREDEAIRFHQNTLLNRFQSADAQGQALLSFSGRGMDLALRNNNGNEAPLASVERAPEE